MKNLFCAVCTAVLLATNASAVVCRIVTEPWGAAKWSSVVNWFARTQPGPDDTACIERAEIVQGLDLADVANPSLHSLVVSNSSTASGWDVNFVVKNGSLTFAGDATLRNELWSNGRKFTATAAICGTGDNTLTVTGAKVLGKDSVFEYQAPFRQLSRVTQMGNTAQFTQPGDIGVAGGEFRLSSGVLRLPNAGEYDLDHLTVDGSMTQLSITNGATLRIGRLDFVHGAPLTIVALGDGELGKTAKVFVDGYADGCVDARIVQRSPMELATPIRFLRYDAENGFVPVTSFDAFADGGDLGVVSSETSVTVTKDTRMKALILTGAGVTLTVAEGATLTLGDGTVPGGISVSDPSTPGTGTAKTLVIGGTGTIACGAHAGVFWLDIARDSKYPGYKTVRLAVPTIGSGGITFANCVPTGNDHSITFVEVATSALHWTGGARYSGTIMRIASGLACPSPAYLEGVNGRASRIHSASGLNNISPVFVLGGGGTALDGQAVSGNGITTLTNAITLTSDVVVQGDNSNTGFRFGGPISGVGGLVLLRRTLELTNHNTFAGGLAVMGYSWDKENPRILTFRQRGNAGTGPLNAENTDSCPVTLSFVAMTGAEFLGPIQAAKYPVKFTTENNKPSRMSFFAPAAFAASTLSDNVCLGLGADVSFASMTNKGVTTISGVGTGGTLVLKDAGNWSFAPKFTDTDEAPVALVKRGAGTLSLHRGGNRGGVSVEAGTLVVKGAKDIFSSPDLAFRLDAARNVVTDDAGNVTKWTSVGPDATEFVIPTFQTSVSPKLTADAVQGTRLVSLGDAYNQRLQASKETTQRTVFLVMRGKLTTTEPVHKDHNAGVFGQAGKDFGLRCVAGGLQGNPGDVHFHSRNLRINGKALAKDQHYLYPDDTSVFLVTLVRDVASDARATFAPVLGNYANWITDAWFPGAFAEVVAFKSVLTDAEILQIEQTLAAKWGLTLAKQAAAPADAVVSGDVFVGANGTLDLDGNAATVSALAGSGTIRTAADKPAVLTVTGTNAFAGTVSGPVTLVSGSGAMGAASDVTAAFRDGAQFKLDGASGSLGAHLGPVPVANGLTLHLDASLPDAVEYDAETMKVSRWKSAEAFGPDFVADPTSRGPKPPLWDATGFDGKPSVHVAQVDASLAATAKTNLTTLVLVFRADAANDKGYFFGARDEDAGVIYDDSTHIRYNGVAMDRPGGLRRVYTTSGWKNYDNTVGKLATPASAPCILVLGIPSWHEYFSSYQGKKFSLGKYFNDARLVYFSEILAYERLLTDVEIVALGEHLSAKWFGSVLHAREANFDATSGMSFGAGGGVLNGDLTLTNSVTFDFAGAAALAQPLLQVNGTLTLSDVAASFLNFEALARRTKHVYLRASRITGDFSATDLADPRWSRLCDETSQSLLRAPGLLMLVR